MEWKRFEEQEPERSGYYWIYHADPNMKKGWKSVEYIYKNSTGKRFSHWEQWMYIETPRGPKRGS